MTRDPEKSVRSEQAKAYAKPTLERRAKLSDVAEGAPPIVPVSGAIFT